MYALNTTFSIEAHRLSDLRATLECDYLPQLRLRPGFRAVLVLCDSEENGTVQLLQVWDTHADAEAFARTGALGNLLRQFKKHESGLRVQSQGYNVRAGLHADIGSLTIPTMMQ